jgi:hypothetical protein
MSSMQRTWKCFFSLLLVCVSGSAALIWYQHGSALAQLKQSQFRSYKFFYNVNNRREAKCIDVAGAPGTENGAKLQLWDCERTGRNRDNGSGTDQFWVTSSDGFIKNVKSGKCIDVAGAPGTANGAALQLWDCETSGVNKDNGTPTDQKWTYKHIDINGRRHIFIINKLSGKCIDVAGAPGTENGAKLQLWDCETSGVNKDNGTPTDQGWDTAGFSQPQ